MFALNKVKWGAKLRQLFVLFLEIVQRIFIYLSRHDSFKWIRKYIPHTMPSITCDSNKVEKHLTSDEVSLEEGEFKENQLDDILVVGDIITTTDDNNIADNAMTSIKDQVTAPIARMDDEEEVEEEEQEKVMEVEENKVPLATSQPTLRRGKSRVRTYLRKCKERLTAHQTTLGKQKQAAFGAILLAPVLENGRIIVCNYDTHVRENSRQDVTEGETTPTPTANIANKDEVVQQENKQQIQLSAQQQFEPALELLLTTHVKDVFSHYYGELTRLTILKEARELLVQKYDTNLDMFEKLFLKDYAAIARTLLQQHAHGDCILWYPGWPLVTPTGQLILHLGTLDDSQLQPGDFYICTQTEKTVENCQTKLHVVWCNTTTTSIRKNIVKSRCIDIIGESNHLNIITLETMLSDELPQLLQNLLVGVERAIGRVSLHDLQQIPITTISTPLSLTTTTSTTLTSTPTTATTLSGDIDITNNNSISSPKCALKRSELITKNKHLFTNKYALRRVTNRQDSMNSMSSGTSCTSSGSASSDDLIYGCHNHNNNNINMNNINLTLTRIAKFNKKFNNDQSTTTTTANATSTETTTTTTINNNNNSTSTTSSNASTSPALPLFCLGNSFPHIDSDEENVDDKRCNGLEDDHQQAEIEIVPPKSISEIPDKLFTSGIYLPGVRDLKNHPIVNINAAEVIAAGLNCYEIATVLLYYSTIQESFSSCHSAESTQLENTDEAAHDVSETTTTPTTPLLQQPAINEQQQQNDNHRNDDDKTTTTTTITPTPLITTTTFTILIAIEKSHHLCVIDLICQSLRLLTRQIAYCEILVVCLCDHVAAQQLQQQYQMISCCKNGSTAPTLASNSSLTRTTITTNMITSNNNNNNNNNQNGNNIKKEAENEGVKDLVKFISVNEVTTSVVGGLPNKIPYDNDSGLHYHDARKWLEFFQQLEPFQRQCAIAGQRLVAAMNDIRMADLQGLPTRRQLYAQHRALSRALMDSELHNMRKKGATSLANLSQLAYNLNYNNTKNTTSYNYNNNNNNNNNTISPIRSSYNQVTKIATYQNNNNNINNINRCNNNNNDNSNNINSRKQQLSAKSINYSFNTIKDTTTMTSRCNGYDNDDDDNDNNDDNNNDDENDDNDDNINNNNKNITTTTTTNSNNNSLMDNIGNIDVAIRLQKVTLLFTEVERAAKRLEQLTEQRRERLRELTRQRALEDEINEVTSWITSDGNETLQRFANLQLDYETTIKELEQDFEKYYFISMKHLAKGRDLHEAAENMEALRESAVNLKTALDCFAEKLEQARERVEGAARLHHLLNLHMRDENTRQEMQRLAEQIGAPGLLEKYCQQQQLEEQQQHDILNTHTVPRQKPTSLNIYGQRSSTKTSDNIIMMCSSPMGGSSTTSSNSHLNTSSGPIMLAKNQLAVKTNRYSHRLSSGNGSLFDARTVPCHCWRESSNLEDMDELLDVDEEEEDGEDGEQSKIADSGLGGCDRCESNGKMTRVCSCQSLNETTNLFTKSHNIDELDDECFDRMPAKRYLDIHSPMEANSHLQCHASNLELPKMEELSCLDPKIQKMLLLIMREMIGTERDYVRSLYYVIENYVDELHRDDIPQPLRGQRNVIFGNIEKIFEFHNSHFLSELERYEHNPLKVGAAFLEMETKFYLYALYNKNKPKSDTLMSEYGTQFFKSKQYELNDKMDLASYLLKPVQRMGKYALLLQQLVKACSTVEGSALQEIISDVEELQRAEEMVKFQLRHGNDLLAMDSLRDCDVNVKEQGRLLRQNEFLVWQGRGGKKSLRQVFLFEELVLFSKARRFPDHKNLDLYIYKNSIKTSDIGLTAHIGDSPTKFEIWFRKRKPGDTWTLQCMSEDIKHAWTDEISKLLWKQAKKNREIRLAELSSMGIGSKPCLDIRPSNNQINDRSITLNQLGKAPKLRHSFIGVHADQGKSSRRPNSLISESSISSGTSSSSLSTGSTSGQEPRLHAALSASAKSQTLPLPPPPPPPLPHQMQQSSHILELINETQALRLSSGTGQHQHLRSSSNHATTMPRNHKRSTTLVSQLSTESGIIADISMTSMEREQADATDVSFHDIGANSGATVVMRRHHKTARHERTRRTDSEHTNDSGRGQDTLTSGE